MCNLRYSGYPQNPNLSPMQPRILGWGDTLPQGAGNRVSLVVRLGFIVGEPEAGAGQARHHPEKQPVEYVHWGKGDDKNEVPAKGAKALDTVTEALIGAVYLDTQNRGCNAMTVVMEMLARMDYFDPVQ
jgi:hypothetical protein